jgi:hypothetical protein
MDDRERDRLYSSGADDPDETDEYELEPPDPEVLAGEQRRAHDAIESTRMSVDIDEIYREVERDRGREILEGWLHNFQFRFQVKHLLIATAVLAILLTLYKLGLMALVVVAVMLSIAGVYLYLQWQEKKYHDEADRRRQQLYAQRRAQLGKKPAPADADAVPAQEAAEPAAPLPPLVTSQVDEIWQKARASQEFRFRFSMQQLLVAITAAALVFGVVQLSGPSNAATLLGLIALLGLVIYALGFEPAEVVVLGWWLILVMYVALSIVGAMWTGLT